MAAPHLEHAPLVSAHPVSATPTTRPPHPRQQDGGKTNVPLSADCPSTVMLQQRCHHTSTLAPSPFWPPMPRPRLELPSPPGAAWQEKIRCGSHCLAREDPAPHCGTEFNQPHPEWAPDSLMVGIRSPDGLVVGSCTRHHRVLGSIPKRAYDSSALHSTSH
jgi:hypothetical protein